MILIAINRPNVTENEIIGLSLTILLEGFETCSILISTALYEIARHPQCQANLLEEIHSTVARHQNQMTFDALHEMKYLNCVINGANNILI